ncbi:hypothetical protein [Paenibacillus tianmuensis]|nr:hypothetical protein [Paenibacillus tianmuensis]
MQVTEDAFLQIKQSWKVRTQRSGKAGREPDRVAAAGSRALKPGHGA